MQEFACNGTVVEDDESGQVIQLQGDQRTKIRQFLVDSELFSEKEAKEKITIHGSYPQMLLASFWFLAFARRETLSLS